METTTVPVAVPSAVAPFITAHAVATRTAVAGRAAPVAVSVGQVVAWQVKGGGIRFGECAGQAFNLNGVSMIRVLVIDVRAIPATATEWPMPLPIIPVMDGDVQKTRTIRSKAGERQAFVWETASLPAAHVVTITQPTVAPSARKSKSVDTISI